jgi:hypothetical protein
MTDHEIKLNLEKAIDRLFVNDFYLIQNAAHERSITHMLARHLVDLFPDYDIDCEYDLDITNVEGSYPLRKEIEILENELKKVKKYIKDSPDKFINDYSEILVPINIYPDIIIHKRGTNKLNTLIIELKKSINNNAKSNKLDKLKLKAYTSQRLHYRLGAYINLSVGKNFERNKTKIEYYKDGKKQATK